MALKKIKFMTGFAVITACLLYLIVSGFQETAMYYFTVSELQAREAEFVDKRIKLAGKVVPGSIQKEGQTLAVKFQILDPLHTADFPISERRTIHYKGVVPDTFRDKADVVLEGKTGTDGIFYAETLLAKCPSKYQSESYENNKKIK